jgi:solute:Na+ symporter, SSS family
VPGMLAVALASIGNKGYELPRRAIPAAAVAPASAVIKSASMDQIDAVVKQLNKVADIKFVPAKVAAIVKDNTAAALPEAEIHARLKKAAENDYDGVILSLVTRYCPSGLMGLALTALLASFMSGMAGNVTAFNTVSTYDLYQAYIARKKSDDHYFWIGRVVTVLGVLLSIGCAYFARQYNNAMDVIQLVFGFVNAPLFATFLLGMFWVRTTGTGAFFGLLIGTLTSAGFHAVTIATGNTPGVKGGYLGVLSTFPSEMAQNFWLASFAFSSCLILTIVISLATKQTKTNEELKGLVYSLTPKIKDDEQNFFLRPGVLGIILLIACAVLNYLVW